MSDYTTSHSVPVLSSFLDRMKPVKKFGLDHQISTTSIPIMNAIMFLFFASVQITILSLHLLAYAESFLTIPRYVYEIASYSQLGIWALLLVISLPLTSKIMILVESYAQKIIHAGINQLDLVLWNRYRLESPIAQAIWKTQHRLNSLSPQSKRQIGLGVLCIFSLYALYRLGYF